MADTDQTNLTSLTVDLLSAYFANNVVDSAQLSGLIRSTHDALKGIDSTEPDTPVEPEFTPAVTARKSVSSPEHIISLIDGKPYKTLKRHLSRHGLTPEQYRERYKLPINYPMVAPSYSARRREVAEKLGLGRKTLNQDPLVEEAPIESQPAPTETLMPKAAKAKASPKTASVTKAKATPAPKAKPVAAKKLAARKAKPAPATSAQDPVGIAAAESQPLPPSPAPAAEPAPKKASTRKPKVATAPVEVVTSVKAAPKRAPRKSKAATPADPS